MPINKTIAMAANTMERIRRVKDNEVPSEALRRLFRVHRMVSFAHSPDLTYLLHQVTLVGNARADLTSRDIAAARNKA